MVVYSDSGTVVTDDPSFHPHQTVVMRRLRLSPMFTTPAVGYWGSVIRWMWIVPGTVLLYICRVALAGLVV